MLLLYPCASLDQMLTENVAQSIRNMTQNTCGQKKIFIEASFSNKTKICDFSIFAMSWRATFFLTCPYLNKVEKVEVLSPQFQFNFLY